MNTKFKAAVKRAKALYKTGRYKKFSDAVKASYKTGARSTAPRRTKPKGKPMAKRKSAPAAPRKRSTVATYKAKAKNILTNELGQLLTRHSLMPSKGNKQRKRKLAKLISKKKSEIKKLD